MPFKLKNIYLSLPTWTQDIILNLLSTLGFNSRECKTGFLDGYGAYKDRSYLGGISNQFIWDRSYSCKYVIENILAIYSLKRTKSNHIITFFDATGRVVYEYNLSLSEFSKKIDINHIISNIQSDFGSFTHHIYYDINPNINFWTRGYTEFSINSDKSISMVHGNIGHIERSPAGHFISHSQLSSRHVFRPPILLTPGNEYFFYYVNTFLDSFSFSMDVKTISDKFLKTTKYSLPPFGTIKIPYIPSENEVVDFTSNFSGFRPIILVSNSNYIDLFHA